VSIMISTDDLEYRTISETRRRTLNDGSKTLVETKVSRDDFINLEYEVGTTGEAGGDWGHGSRVYLRLENQGSTGWKITATDNKVEIILGGDGEIEAIKQALRFMLQTLEEQTQEEQTQEEQTQASCKGESK